MDKFRLDGRTAVVTGGASGIGYAIASCFADQGAAVRILDLDEARAASTAEVIGGDVSWFTCDVTDVDSVARAFEKLKNERIDILVNSAGVAHIGSVLSTSPDDFDRLFRVNVRGTYLCMRGAVERMKAQHNGVILNLASIAATAALADRFAYSMTKGAVLSMTLSVARDYIADGIRCNCISPARVHTPFVDGYLARTYPGREAEMYAKLEKTQPIGRMGRPEEVADLALYLCSDAAGFVTGVDYPIDGGFFNLR